MPKKRVIVKIEIDERKAINTKQFSFRKYLGDPINITRVFSAKSVDEILLVDVGAAQRKYPIQYEFLSQIAMESAVPITYAGGVSSPAEAKKVIKIGFEKIGLNTMLFDNPSRIKDIAGAIGAQSIVASLDFKSKKYGHSAFYLSGQKDVNLNCMSVMKKILELDVGEVLINSIDRHGSLQGPCLTLIKSIPEDNKRPIIYSGGIDCFDSIINTLKQKTIDAVAVGTYFSLLGPELAPLQTYISTKQRKKIEKI